VSVSLIHATHQHLRLAARLLDACKYCIMKEWNNEASTLLAGCPQNLKLFIIYTLKILDETEHICLPSRYFLSPLLTYFIHTYIHSNTIVCSQYASCIVFGVYYEYLALNGLNIYNNNVICIVYRYFPSNSYTLCIFWFICKIGRSTNRKQHDSLD